MYCLEHLKSAFQFCYFMLIMTLSNVKLKFPIFWNVHRSFIIEEISFFYSSYGILTNYGKNFQAKTSTKCKQFLDFTWSMCIEDYGYKRNLFSFGIFCSSEGHQMVDWFQEPIDCK